MKIFRQEQLDGLEGTIANSQSIAFQSVVQESNDVDEAKRLANASGLNTSFATNEGQFDLHYVNTILVSTGWNKNDDVFSQEEAWSARNSPEDKPINFEHDPSDIIGHITGNHVINDTGSIIEQGTSVDNLPERFHILTSGVLYKHIASRDSELEDRISTIIEEISRGEWFVSMEAIFNGFDYAVVTPEGESKTVSRSEDSAFLTKHLKAYGGTGFYEGYKVGRLIKEIIFSGKGLVRKPANPQSVFVFSDIDPFDQNTPIASELQTISSSLNKKENSFMSDEKTLQVDVNDLKKRFEEMDATAVQAEFDELNDKIKAQEKSLADLASINESLEEQLSSVQAEKEELTKSLAEISEGRDKLQEELDTIKAEADRAAKVAMLTEAGLDIEAAEETFAKFEHLDDEQFAEIVSVYTKLSEQSEAKEEVVAEEVEEVEEAEVNAEETVDSDPAEVIADEQALEDAEEEVEAALSTPGETPQSEHEELIASLGAYLDNSMHRN